MEWNAYDCTIFLRHTEIDGANNERRLIQNPRKIVYILWIISAVVSLKIIQSPIALAVSKCFVIAWNRLISSVLQSPEFDNKCTNLGMKKETKTKTYPKIKSRRDLSEFNFRIQKYQRTENESFIKMHAEHHILFCIGILV